MIPELFGISIEVYIFLIILAIPTYFFWLWVLKKFIKARTRRIVSALLATLIFTPVIYIAAFLLIFLGMTYYPNRHFDPATWKDASEKRYELTSDLISSKKLIGKTKSDVRQLLGDGGNKDTADTWYYELGYRPEIGNIDPDCLEINFKDLKVSTVIWHKR